MSNQQNTEIKQPRYRNAELTERRNLKMAGSIHAYVRGNTAKYYDWLKQAEISSIPHRGQRFGFVEIVILGIWVLLPMLRVKLILKFAT